MARNRKTQSAAVRFGPALKAFILCLAIALSGIGYVWQKNQIFQLGQQKKQREVRLKKLQDLNKASRDQLDYLRSYRMLEARVKELNLGLVQPQPQQIWRLPALMPGPVKVADIQVRAEG